MLGSNDVRNIIAKEIAAIDNNNNNIRNWPLPIGAFQDQCKQIVINKHNMVKNPNWREADQLAIYKRR